MEHLPAPLLPTSPSICPLGRVKEMSLRAGGSSGAYCRPTCSIAATTSSKQVEMSTSTRQPAACLDLVTYSHRTADVVGRVTHLVGGGSGTAETQHLAVDARLHQSFTNAVQRAAK